MSTQLDMLGEPPAMPKLRPPFKYFGGKRRVAAEVWARFGDNLKAYVEPFAGSLAVLLAAPKPAAYEVVSDADGLLVNVWRAIKWAPDDVAAMCEWPPTTVDLSARSRWLARERESLTSRLLEDPEWYDTKAAAWWLWGQSCWIGDGFAESEQSGLNRATRYSRGTIDGGKDPRAYIQLLSARLSRVQILAGDWSKAVTPASMFMIPSEAGSGPPRAIFLDPPYLAERRDCYVHEGLDTSAVREWAIKHGDNQRMRIALCGYDGEHDMPDSWECFKWNAHGGYAHTGNGRGKVNAKRERIWFSPHCLRPVREAVAS